MLRPELARTRGSGDDAARARLAIGEREDGAVERPALDPETASVHHDPCRELRRDAERRQQEASLMLGDDERLDPEQIGAREPLDRHGVAASRLSTSQARRTSSSVVRKLPIASRST